MSAIELRDARSQEQARAGGNCISRVAVSRRPLRLGRNGRWPSASVEVQTVLAELDWRPARGKTHPGTSVTTQ